MKVYQHTTFYEHSWGNVTLAFWRKYPNPFASHVLAGDVISRQVSLQPTISTDSSSSKILPSPKHPENHLESATPSESIATATQHPILSSTRIFLKKGSLPNWSKVVGLKSSAEAWIIETSFVDPVNKVMVTKTKNMTMRRLMQVEEVQTVTPHPSNPEWTKVVTEARIVSNIGWGLKSRIEGFGLSRLPDNLKRSRQGLLHVLETLSAEMGCKSPTM